MFKVKESSDTRANEPQVLVPALKGDLYALGKQEGSISVIETNLIWRCRRKGIVWPGTGKSFPILCPHLQQYLKYLVVRTETFLLVSSLAWEVFEIVPHVSSALCLHSFGLLCKELSDIVLTYLRFGFIWTRVKVCIETELLVHMVTSCEETENFCEGLKYVRGHLQQFCGLPGLLVFAVYYPFV